MGIVKGYVYSFYDRTKTVQIVAANVQSLIEQTADMFEKQYANDINWTPMKDSLMRVNMYVDGDRRFIEIDDDNVALVTEDSLISTSAFRNLVNGMV